MASPYAGLNERQFWKLAVEPKDINTVSDIYTKKFPINGLKVATAGSCFAQEIAKALRKNGYTVIDNEPPPQSVAIRGPLTNSFGYGLYSARHGNIYTVRQLLQLTKEAFGILSPSPDLFVWKKGDRFYDALRPGVEPNGLDSVDEVVLQRKDHIRRFRKVLEDCDLFIFTLGLTEAWIHKSSGMVYPTAPGVIAGAFDASVHEFRNFSFTEIYEDFKEFRSLLIERKPSLKFLVTVSPVPLTASFVDGHVLVSTVRSKSVLRAVTSQLYDDFSDIDYFPSYELFSTPFLGGAQFEANKRSVTKSGVASVMNIFFGQHHGNLEDKNISQNKKMPSAISGELSEDVICEEALLEAFVGEVK